MFEINNKAKPFLKWAGGKGQLLPQLEMALPSELYNNPFTYIEPFVGGGAMLFFMLQKFPNIKQVVINDINSNLTGAYQTIKDDPKGLIFHLKSIERRYFSFLNNEEQKTYFLDMRRRFNQEQLTLLEKSAILIFLNRTCFNGLYRENSKGFFNVPFGRYANPTICNEELIYADSDLLNKYDVKILTGDYKQTAKEIKPKGLNFFYFDPPYRPLSATSSFNKFVKEEFGDNEQKNLADFCRKLSKKNNILWMLSNSDCSAKNPYDNFFEEIYNGFNIDRVYAVRAINANPSKRGKLTELLISNFSKQKEYNMTAEEIIELPEYKEDFLFEYGENSVDIFSTDKYKKDIAKTKNYKTGVYFHANGGSLGCGLGPGLYLGKDLTALHNFYNGEGEFGDEVVEYHGDPKFADLVLPSLYERYEEEAIKLFGKQEDNNHLRMLALKNGFDGIRYFDPYTTGEEFVLFKTDKVKKVKAIKTVNILAKVK